MSAYTEFSIDRPLSSCVVTRELAGKLQKLLENAEKQLMRDIAPAAKRRYSLSVMDDLGTEAFSSADDIPTSAFPESTETARFVLESESAPAHDGQSRLLNAK